MNKTFMTVSLTLHDGEDWGFEDYIDDNGKFQPLGVRALAMLEKHQQIYINDGGYIDIIPYHAIVKYAITKATHEYTQPEDAFCNEDVCPTSPNCGGGSAERIWTLGADYGDAYDKYDLVLGGHFMIPYLLSHNIPVSFNGSNVTSASLDDWAHDVELTIVAEDGTHTIALPMSGDYTYEELEVDGESVESVSFTIGTDKRYVAFTTGGDTGTMVSENLYKVGDKPVVSGEYDYYLAISPNSGSEQLPFPEGGIFPAVENDTWYTLS